MSTWGIFPGVNVGSISQSIVIAPLPCKYSSKTKQKTILLVTLGKTHKAISEKDNIICSIIKLFIRSQGNKQIQRLEGVQASHQGETGEGVKEGLPEVASEWLRKCCISENGGFALLLPSRDPFPGWEVLRRRLV